MLNRKTKFDKLRDRVKAETKAKLYQEVNYISSGRRDPSFGGYADIFFSDDRMVERINNVKRKGR
jgi:hypothetical protein